MAQVFYDWLLTVVDDYGRFDARPAILRAEVFPLLLDLVREADVQRCLDSCETAGLVRLYKHDGRPYLEVLDFRQRMRAAKSKYPAPESAGHPPDIAMQMPDGRTTMPSESDAETETETIHPRPREAPPDTGPADPLREAKASALTAMGQWSACAPPVGRGYGLKTWENEHAAIWSMVDVVSQDTPIVRGGEQVRRHLLIPQAVEVLKNKGRRFKNPAFAAGCVKSELSDWANAGISTSNGKHSEADNTAAFQRKLQEMKARSA